MESSAASYLHKKFKKQLSIEPKHHHESKSAAGVVVSGEEKIAKALEEIKNRAENQTRQDNKDVPNQSTNQNVVANNSTMSSISVEKCIANLQSANSCISYVVSCSQEQSRRFDNKAEPASSTVCTSSILDNLYIKHNYITKTEDAASINTQDKDPSTDESPDRAKSDDAQPLPDKSSGGKYVCHYCNLVCSKPSVLQKHIRAHTNERPYPCNSCGFSFKTRSNLYKHCRSRTHANRVMGNKAQEINNEIETPNRSPQRNEINEEIPECPQDLKTKPYKPRFHTAKHFYSSLTKENVHEEEETTKNTNTDLLSHHINEIISKNNSIVNSGDTYLLKKRPGDVLNDNNNEYLHRSKTSSIYSLSDEPLNLTNKNRKRCLSEVVEPIAQKSLIKELLLKNLNSDMQCPHCKMIFQTVTELELHKLRSCKGFVKPGAKYSRSSSVNVASILTQNKNAFDNIPHLQNASFPLKSPGPFLGKTRLVESDKSKSFSFDDGIPSTFAMPNNDRYLLSPLTLQCEKEKRPAVKLFGGEVKITQTSGETKSFKIDNKEDKYDASFVEYGGKLSENRVVKSSLQSGGTVLTNKTNYGKQDLIGSGQDVIRVYENTSVSPSIDMANLGKSKFNFDRQSEDLGFETFSTVASPSYKYPNIVDFSQKAVKLLTPNLKQPNLAVPGVPVPSNFTFNSSTTDKIAPSPVPNVIKDHPDKFFHPKVITPQSPNFYNPMNLLVNGKVVRHVPGIPGPVAAEEPVDLVFETNIVSTKPSPRKPEKNDSAKELRVTQLQPPAKPKPSKSEVPEIKTDIKSPAKILEKAVTTSKITELTSSGFPVGESKKFARPNSLALKPTTASLKQHHGLTPTMFNQILISPDTPRVAKKYVQQFLHGNYFSYLGLKCSTKPVYCTLNKTQPFYVPHFKKLSMYSEWRQQDTKADKLYVSSYDSRQKPLKYTTAGKTVTCTLVHSSYKFVPSESSSKGEKSDDLQKSNAILGGYECNEDYTYIRGRGRGRYVCNQCGIRCKKPSMLKKHIKTHSDDRPYSCNHCNFSFKTKGNLTKHMKSKAHNKNYTATGSSSSSTQQSGTQSSDSDTDDSGMDSSDESTRREEHEAAYGLLSLSQKTSQNIVPEALRKESASPTSTHTFPASDTLVNVMNTEEIAHVSKTNYAKNKILDEKTFSAPKNFNEIPTTDSETSRDVQNLTEFLGSTSISRPLTYPYSSILSSETSEVTDINAVNETSFDQKLEIKSIKQFHVIQRYGGLASAEKLVIAKHVENSFQERGKVSFREAESPFKIVQPPILKVNDVILSDNVMDVRKRKLQLIENFQTKLPKTDEVMDLSMTTEKNCDVRLNGSPIPLQSDIIDYSPPTRLTMEQIKSINNEVYSTIQRNRELVAKPFENDYKNNEYKKNGNVLVLTPLQSDNVNINYVLERPGESPNSYKSIEYDNSAMETLADIATKQVKLEKNTLAKSVASEFLKIATKNEFSGEGGRDAGGFGGGHKEVNELIVKPEGSKSCSICSKSFSKPPQLRLHMNIHYLERPFRCHSCSVSFRTKGHLQKHERSASHHNKLSSSPALSSSEPRPFKCIDCNIAFRIHGHLAKHLRSKMHIMKLECLAKIPFGLYAELERSNSLLTEINTADGDQCLESLKTLAKKVFINDPNKLTQLHPPEKMEADS